MGHILQWIFIFSYRLTHRRTHPILVSDIRAIREELESKGVKTGNWRVDERRGQKFQVFFAVAPDGLCYYFHEPV